MKRFGSVVAASVLLGSFALAAPASADFHLQSQACATAVGIAGVGLTEAAGTFTFTGSVTCNGATSVTITSLTFAPVPSNGYRPFGRDVIPPPTPVPASTANSNCAPCGPTPVTATGTTPSAPGLYTVLMTFTAVGPGGTFTPTRKAGFAWSGAGAPVAYCTQSQCGAFGTPTG